MNKKLLSERDILKKFIIPALKQAGWDEMTQIREEVGFSRCRITARDKLVTPGKATRADYTLRRRMTIIPLHLVRCTRREDSDRTVAVT